MEGKTFATAGSISPLFLVKVRENGVIIHLIGMVWHNSKVILARCGERCRNACVLQMAPWIPCGHYVGLPSGDEMSSLPRVN